ncbi:hypothetical protein Kpol_495p5 [Vanderwaltozyma polyspora DSM 70294]|uniref:ATPase AAA-type core domain-containing protein n=1 Tax=Vanderwaltozyma polyspora (strain ATCC 22028 / DSM 70294 / BCRC 21397 / CBS 2163 / NBRC 10782 / NRRL Y-8283 / UCD 57-17) TaxID=436907 RepID=A7TNY2_VANPO|nr:uncharacterized protein Kpol_495p5 [Vanderwaltozyma polyspora DSM 70294]EDO16007.1 hypothetical protein Kpol_495p5 [Vanderwaltozyma polyspora DSM 70294]
MKKAVNLRELLNGNTKKPSNDNEGVEDQTVSFIDDSEITSNDSINISLEQSSPLIKSSQVSPVLHGENLQSMKDFLMNKKNNNENKKQDKDKNIEVILLEPEDGPEVDVMDIDNESDNSSLQNLTNPKRLADPPMYKKTKLTDILAGPKKAISISDKVQPVNIKNNSTSNNSTSNNSTSNNSTSNNSMKKLSSAQIFLMNNRNSSSSKDKSKIELLETPLPLIQLTIPDNDFDNGLNDDIILPLCRIPQKVKPTFLFQENDYKSINQSTQETSFKQVEKVEILESPLEDTAIYNKIHTIWPDFFKPQLLKEVLLEPKIKSDIQSWLAKAFEMLKKNTTRNKLSKTQKSEDKDLANFIVFDDLLDDNPNEVEEFVPLMILHGNAVGKNTLLKIIMDSLNGQIYEVNTSTNRAKKDILDTLLEFSTSHYVKAKGSKGLILLDDVDVLFKEHDKFFWQGIEKLLKYSRRPVVLTCRDLDFIPTNLIDIAMEENSCFQLKRVSHNTVVKTLERLGLKVGFSINNSVLESIVRKNKNDIRKCLMDLQFYLVSPASYYLENQKIDNDAEAANNLVYFSDRSDLSSISDVLESTIRFKSAIKEGFDNTLMTSDAIYLNKNSIDDQQKWKNDYMIDYRVHLKDDIKTELKDFELNIGGYLNKYLSIKNKKLVTKNCPSNKFKSILTSTVSFLNTRRAFTSRNFETTTRRTRNSNLKKMQDILVGFNPENNPPSFNDTTNLDFSLSTKKNISTYTNPYVLSIATSEEKSRLYNRQLFVNAIAGFPESRYSEIYNKIVLEGHFKQNFFEADPKIVIKSWGDSLINKQ